MRRHIRAIAFVTAVCVSACGSIPLDAAAMIVGALAASPADSRFASPADNGAVTGETAAGGESIASSWSRAIVLLLIIVIVILLIYRTYKGWKPTIS